MNAAAALRTARHRAGLSLRELATRAAGYAPTVELTPNVGGADRRERGRELREVLDLAAKFPARHSAKLAFPRFGAA